MSDAATKRTIDRAFVALEYACERGVGDARKIFDELVKLETEHEKGHRNFAPTGHTHRFSARTVVKFFVVRSVLAAIPAPKSWGEYASYNTRTKLGQELKATLIERCTDIADEFANDPHVIAFAHLDYLTDVTNAKV